MSDTPFVTPFVPLFLKQYLLFGVGFRLAESAQGGAGGDEAGKMGG